MYHFSKFSKILRNFRKISKLQNSTQRFSIANQYICGHRPLISDSSNHKQYICGHNGRLQRFFESQISTYTAKGSILRIFNSQISITSRQRRLIAILRIDKFNHQSPKATNLRIFDSQTNTDCRPKADKQEVLRFKESQSCDLRSQISITSRQRRLICESSIRKLIPIVGLRPTGKKFCDRRSLICDSSNRKINHQSPKATNFANQRFAN